ncbi:MAG: hypothetical protein NUV34_01130 [Sulfuricaulis sp.]|nr:hypothetical protein [Sulfuricaulis sp.]
MQAEFKTAQLRVRKNCILAEGSDGSIFWATPTRARLLIDAGAAELVNAGPSVAPTVGPSETKPMEPAEKKSFAVAQAGPSTDFPLSSELGTAAQSSALVEAHRLPQNNVQQSKKRGRPRKSE